jgi:uncharacterized membrane protein YcaP (DUF421 family)
LLQRRGAGVGHVAGHHAVAGAVAGCAIGHQHAKVVEERLIGSNLSRALTQGSPYFPTLAATAGIVIVYWVSIQLAQRPDFVGLILKGRSVVIVRNAEADPQVMRRRGVSHLDLAEA